MSRQTDPSRQRSVADARTLWLLRRSVLAEAVTALLGVATLPAA
jgi:hypothetical protein